MAFNKITDTLDVHQQRSTRPIEPGTTLQALFDQDVNTVKTRVNEFIDELESTTDGNSGMDNIGMTPINGVMTTPQQALEYLKSRVDATQPTLNIVSVLDYGAIDDGVTDNTTFIKNAIAAANGGVVWFPYTDTGVYLVSSQIVAGTSLAEGLSFIASKRGGNDAADGVVIKYTGSDICFDIQQPNGTAEVGQWSWENLTFQCTSVAGGMFQFNDVTLAMTDDNTSPNYIRQLMFRACSFWGEGSTAVTGNAIQGLGVFELVIDENCYFRGWKRALYLKGCDNCTLAGRYINNVRHIMLIRSNTFGNACRIDSRFLGTLLIGGIENAYQLYLEAYSTSVYSPFIEQTDAQGASDYMMYIDGYCISIYNPFISHSIAQKVWKIGPNARAVAIYNPVTTNGVGLTFDYDDPASWQWTGIAESYKITIFDPSIKFERILTEEIRQEVISRRSNADKFKDTIGRVGNDGQSISNFKFSPYTLDYGRPLGGFNFINAIATDSNGNKGKAIEVANNRSCLFELIVGEDIQEGDTIQVAWRHRNEAIPSTGTFRWIIAKNGVNITNSNFVNTTTYQTKVKTYTLSGFSNGDRLEIGVYNTSDENGLLSDVNVSINPNNNDSWNTTAPTTGFHNKGEKVWVPEPVAGGYIGYVCTVEGTPGTWKGFGSIQA